MDFSVDAGVVLFNTFLRKVALRKLFLSLALAGVGVRLTQLLLVTGVHTGFILVPKSAALSSRIPPLLIVRYVHQVQTGHWA